MALLHSAVELMAPHSPPTLLIRPAPSRTSRRERGRETAVG